MPLFFSEVAEMVCVPKKIINGTQKSGMVPKMMIKVALRPFFDFKNDENSTFDKECQDV